MAAQAKAQTDTQAYAEKKENRLAIYGTIGSNRHYESQSINGYEYAKRIRSFSKKCI
jgi:hypothetical protein